MIVVISTYCKYQQYFWPCVMLLFGVFGVLAFSPYDFWPASIISLTGFLIKIVDSTWKKAAWYTLFWGIGFFGSGLQWIFISIHQFSNIHICIKIILIILLVLYLTLFPVLFSILLVITQLYIKNVWYVTASIIPVLWSITEYIRGHIFTGFPWLQFGYSQIDGPLKGIAPILGVEGITFVLVLISGFLTVTIKKMQLLPITVSLGILLFLWPLKWIQWFDLQPKRVTHVSLVQGNINQYIKWNCDYVEEVLHTYLKYTFPLLGKTKIVIWPESAIPGNEIEYNNTLMLLDDQFRQYHTNLITGIIGIRCTQNNCYQYNSIIVIGDNQYYRYPSHNRYDKHHLVLWTEHFPLQNIFKPLFNFFNVPIVFMQKGCYLQPQLTVEHIKITAAICYEIIFGKQIRDNFKPSTDFLLTIANNAWFGRSLEPWQYLQMVRMRALELGRPVLCSTNNGITAIVNADGSLKAKLPQFVAAVLSSEVIPTLGLTPYAKFGSWLFWGIVILFIYFILIVGRKNSI